MLTPEQNEQWKSTILADGLESYGEQWQALAVFAALLPESAVPLHHLLQKSEERLAELGVPGWAIQLRGHCVQQGWKARETWGPEFALHSEAALTGVQLHYPANGARVGVYRRVLLRFFHEALTPIVKLAKEGDDRQRNGYQLLIRVHELCQCLLAQPYNPAGVNYAAWTKARKEADPEGDQYLDEIVVSLDLGIIMLGEWQHIVFFPECWQAWWNQSHHKEVGKLVKYLNWLYRQWEKEKPHVTFDSKWIADAYLTALESECPAPDWLPQP